MNTVKYNRLPRPTFRWMKVNELEIDSLREEAVQGMRPQERHEGDVSVTFYTGNRITDLGDFEGANTEALQQTLSDSSSGCAVEIGPHAQGVVWLTYTLTETAPQLTGQLKIKAGAGSHLQIFLDFEGGAEHGAVNLLDYIETEEQAVVKISKVQLHTQNVRHIEHRYAKAGEKSTIDYVTAELGAKTAIIYYKTDLTGTEAVFNSHSMYLGNNDQIFDFSYWVPTQGAATNTDILTTGALLDTSKKYFRGTIDFLRGGKKAVGSESDICILLSPNVHSISVPLLLCKEDDVVGNHASSAGQIDKDKLFYLMSRGFNEAGAQLIIVESNIRPVIDRLGDADLENKTLQAVREKMQFCQKKGDCHAKCTQRFPHLN
ncbi:Fe-S cluster assembly protein SufD [Megasphaera cerevisiae DSM 20462]|uniref:Fe-S cluster assembly protein SufD n=1 Tax=Megasphaera cerevisiae DSM 20462 TaxID=1122219 RepID=A0A0J6WXG0_9FIRM|nr:SufD family Fe-S cluster assembly protein [Megasphaera cerevisiae]KMO86502.1 Fe-S cluster assembly protein SufD [Megasphaera cerevisiae DSM 20462]MCI1749846.1 SufD family Fe-S cluster assembly protein [Megasphaera cerevisiae]OKY54776.1 Fe-S cluster assembly protein SufD [Megasphaera cerevisiae]SJZ91357.1 ABC-type transport system involved in Fe-S cluster assembly, permease component [Megasphaera cerevisiae DSM 20462]